jgi:periplasmic protein TonB
VPDRREIRTKVDAMSSAETIRPILHRSRPTITAWALSALAHAALLAGSGALPFSPAQPGAFREMEVTLMMSGAAPAAARQRVPAAIMTTAASANTPAANSVAESAGGEDRDEPLVESRYDVAALNNPKPPYPLVARRQGAEGRVVLRAQVLVDGRCAEVRIVHSSGHTLLDESALSAVRRWRFVPATRAGTPVAASVDIPISFRLDQTHSSAALAVAR